ncbi:MAG TPA: fibronectin type III domain-containing protein [Acidobacteriota bacterium]|jgi:chitodextrinase|nr:fibronectin type III domain-containing protein [Acidobacteriota bacterium]
MKQHKKRAIALKKLITVVVAWGALTIPAFGQQLPLVPTGDLFAYDAFNLVGFDVSDLNAITVKEILLSPRIPNPEAGIAFDALGNFYVGVQGRLDIYDTHFNLIGQAGVADPARHHMFVALRPPGQAFGCQAVAPPFSQLLVFNTANLQNPTLSNMVNIPFTEQFGGSLCSGIAFDATGHLWVTSFLQLIKLTLDAAGNPTAAQDFFPGGNPNALAFQPATGRLFWSGVNYNFIGVADPANPTLRIATITNVCDIASSSPFMIAFSSSGDMFVSCSNDEPPATTDIVAFSGIGLANLTGTVDASNLGPVKVARSELNGGGFLAFKPITRPTWPPGSTLTASNIDLTSLTLNWTAAQGNAGVTAYPVFQNGTLLAVVAGTVNTFNVTRLTCKTTYTFKVEACSAAGNCSTDGPSLTVTTLTAQQAIQQLITAVNGLVSAGALNAGQANALIASLQAALRQLNAGNTTAAGNELRAFINHVDAYVQAGILSATQGQALRNQAQGTVECL